MASTEIRFLHEAINNMIEADDELSERALLR